MNVRLLVLLVLAVMVSFAACKKNNDAPTVSLMSTLNVIDASPDTVNIYLNGSRLNNNSNLYPSGSSGYFSVLYGLQNYQVKNIFNPATSVVKQLFTIPLTLDTARYYSLFIAGNTTALAFTTLDTLENFNSADSCLVRFVNASPGGSSLDMKIGNMKFSNQAFKSASGFRGIDTSLLKPVSLYQSGSLTPLVSGFFPILPGESYTFYAQGIPGGTGNSALSVGVTVNIN